MSVTIKIDTRTKAAQKLLEYLETLSFVKVEEEKSTYNPEFVEKIKRAEREDGGIEVSSENVWENIK